MTVLTAAQRESFDRDGFLVLDRFVDARACDELIERADELMRTADLTDVRSVFTTKEQERTSDDYFLGSGGEIRFFFEEEAFAADVHLDLAGAIGLAVEREPAVAGNDAAVDCDFAVLQENGSGV